MSASVAPSNVRPAFRSLMSGDPAPWFRQESTTNPDYAFDTVAGRYVVLCFFGTAGDEIGKAAVDAITAHRDLFDDEKLCLFGVSVDRQDRADHRVQQMIPGIRHFWDFDGKVSRLYGALPQNAEPDAVQVPLRRFWFILNPDLRVRAAIPFKADGSDRDEVMAYLRALPEVNRFAGFETFAPILILPNVFEPEFCRHLISLYDQNGGEESGFMREVGGQTVAVHDHSHKRRKDYLIEDQALIKQTQTRIQRRINPEIEKVHSFKPTRMERYIVSCYSAEDGGHFRAHRDNTTKGTAHRRYAVSINLNADFEGGEVSFPEYGSRSYKAPAGGAVVFSCSLLHAVSRVTAGRRFAFLPFLYDDEAARIREANNAFLGNEVGRYKA